MIRWNEPGTGNDVRISVKALLVKIRLRIRDAQKTNFSEYELLSALNDAVTAFWIALSENFSSIPQLTTVLEPEVGVAALPADFYSMVRLQEGATVSGFFVLSEEPKVEITYNRLPVPAESVEDTVEIPAAMILDVVEIAVALLAEGMGKAAEIAAACASRISQKREHGAIKDGTPFP